jgi:ribonuclease HI
MKTIYTDGSCIKNPNGPGGWCAIILDDVFELIISGSDKSTTNNKMELKAVIEALKFIEKGEKCMIYSDSQLTINCASGKWCRKANIDLWNEYEIVSKDKYIDFEWVKAHNGDYYNEKVDNIAYQEAKQIKLK